MFRITILVLLFSAFFVLSAQANNSFFDTLNILSSSKLLNGFNDQSSIQQEQGGNFCPLFSCATQAGAFCNNADTCGESGTSNWFENISFCFFTFFKSTKNYFLSPLNKKATCAVKDISATFLTL